MSENKIWADSAPKYKKDGKMYCSVNYDHNGDPKRIQVAQDQLRKAEFDMDGSTAVYDPHNVITLPEPGEEVREYVGSLPFVQAVDMGGLDE